MLRFVEVLGIGMHCLPQLCSLNRGQIIGTLDLQRMKHVLLSQAGRPALKEHSFC